mgnify:CR=1 FL=1
MNLENELWHLTCLSDIFFRHSGNFLGYEKIYDMSDTIEKIWEFKRKQESCTDDENQPSKLS